jgi:hypothetical protein
MNERLMLFEQWLALNEAFDSASVIDKVKKTLEPKMGELASTYPYGEVKGRERVLFSNKSDKGLQQFILSFNGNDLHSVEFYPIGNVDPSELAATNMSFDEILPHIPNILSQAKPGGEVHIDLKEAERVLKLVPAVEEADSRVQNFSKEGYEYGKKELIFDELTEYINKVVKNIRSSLLVTGMQGIGKTYLTEKALTEMGLEEDKDWFKITGKSTAIGLFQALYQYNGKLLVFDDCDSIWKDEDAKNILKGALDEGDARKISWLSGHPIKDDSGNVLPRKFVFNGRVIFLTNLPERMLPGPIKSRAFIHEMALSPQDMIEVIKEKMPSIKTKYPAPMSFKRQALEELEYIANKHPEVTIDFRTYVKTMDILATTDKQNLIPDMIVKQCRVK